MPLAALGYRWLFDLGAGHAATAVNSANGVAYAAWMGGSGNPSPAFTRGIATNYGGTWHQLNVTSLPNRYIAGVSVDPANPAHAYAAINGYSRRWIDGAGNGVILEIIDGGAIWRDLTGNLPDAARDAVVLPAGEIILDTDVRVFAADLATPTSWARLGTGLPNASVTNLTLAPNTAGGSGPSHPAHRRSNRSPQAREEGHRGEHRRALPGR